MVPVGNVHNLDSLADIMGCKTTQLPMNYLGLPLGGKFQDQSYLGSYIGEDGA
jgi:hypothetical protein